MVAPNTFRSPGKQKNLPAQRFRRYAVAHSRVPEKKPYLYKDSGEMWWRVPEFRKKKNLPAQRFRRDMVLPYRVNISRNTPGHDGCWFVLCCQVSEGH
jgi:hypothetical protein